MQPRGCTEGKNIITLRFRRYGEHHLLKRSLGLLIASLMIIATTAPASVAAETAEPTGADLLEAVEQIEDRLLLGIAETEGDTQAVLLDVLVGVQTFSLVDCTTIRECIDELIGILQPIIDILIQVLCILVDIAVIIIGFGLAVVEAAQAFVDAVIEEVCTAYNGDPDCLDAAVAADPQLLKADLSSCLICCASSTS